jgi:hypothetical protein
MVQFNVCKYILHNGELKKGSKPGNGDIYIQITPTADGSDIYEISGAYCSTTNVNEYISFKLEHFYLRDLKNTLQYEGDTTSQKVCNYILSHKKEFSIPEDYSADKIQRTINSWCVTVGLLLAVSFLHNDKNIWSQMYNDIKYKLHNGTVDTSIFTVNYFQHCIISGTILQSCCVGGWWKVLLPMLNTFKNMWVAGSKINTLDTIRNLYTPILQNLEWSDISMYNILHNNRLQLYECISSFKLKYEKCTQLLNTLQSRCRNRIDDIKENKTNTEIYDVFRNRKFKELNEVLKNDIPTVYEIADMKECTTFIYNFFCEKLEEIEEKTMKEFNETHDMESSQIRTQLSQINIDHRNAVSTNIDYKKRISECKDEREEIILKSKLDRNNNEINKYSSQMEKYSSELLQLEQSKRININELKQSLISKRNKCTKILDIITSGLHTISRTIGRWNIYSVQEIKNCINELIKFQDSFQSVLRGFCEKVKDNSRDNDITEALSKLDRYKMCIEKCIYECNILNENKITYLDCNDYKKECEHIENIINNTYEICGKVYFHYTTWINNLIDNFWKPYKYTDCEFQCNELQLSLSIEGIVFTNLQIQTLIQDYNNNLQLLQSKKYICDNIDNECVTNHSIKNASQNGSQNGLQKTSQNNGTLDNKDLNDTLKLSSEIQQFQSNDSLDGSLKGRVQLLEGKMNDLNSKIDMILQLLSKQK